MSGTFIRLMILAGFALVAGSAMAQYPNRPVKIIVPLVAGSSTDIFTRLIANTMSASLGQPVIVENRPGADGAIAAAEVARAAPDGYTLLMATNSPLSAVLALRKVPPYDPLKDFSPISLVGNYTMFLYVTAALPVKSLQELLDHARANPDLLNYASGNTGAFIAASQMLALGGNLKMVHVPYKGEPAGVADLVANRVQVMFATLAIGGSHAREGKLRILATTQKRRSPAVPDVPTMAEAGVPRWSFYGGWAGVFGPAKMPRDIVERLSREVNTALTRPEVKELLDRQQFFIQGSTPAELHEYTKEQLEKYSRAIREAGIQPE